MFESVSLVPKYLLSGLEVKAKRNNYQPLKIHFSKVCVCAKYEQEDEWSV